MVSIGYNMKTFKEFYILIEEVIYRGSDSKKTIEWYSSDKKHAQGYADSREW